MSILTTLGEQPADGLLALIGLHRADPRPTKIDLGVGVYRDATGATPVFAAVKAAEAKLVSGQATKSYLGAEGDVRFTELLAPIALGEELATSDRLTGVQTPGGTGALRLGAEVLARAAPNTTIWVGTPTWPNHGPIFREAGLAVATHRYFDAVNSRLDFDAMIADLSAARSGDVVLLHGCCHNPTGTGFTQNEWRKLAALCNERGLIPFIDLAYQGLGDGVAADAAGARTLLNTVDEALVAYSCDKNFGLYRERVGALWILSDRGDTVKAVRDSMLVLARSLWSMPPDHGAATVRIILEELDLYALWWEELETMRCRISDLRRRLASSHPCLAPIGEQRGLFAMLPIDRDAVRGLRDRHGIYMADSGRINIAGLSDKNVDTFVAALLPLLPR